MRIRVTIKGYDSNVVETSAVSILRTAVGTGAKVVGPVPLPNRRILMAVNRSPHIYKTSMEHFEVRTHKRLIDIIDPTASTIDSLQHLQLPTGVQISIKQTTAS